MRLPSFVTFVLSAFALSACMQGAAPVSAPTEDGAARKLQPGMSENDAFLALGPESGFEQNPNNWDQSCLSYAYGPETAPKYVHAVFENGVLMQATDGHDTLCSFAAVEPAAA